MPKTIKTAAEPLHYALGSDGATACGWLLGREGGSCPRYSADLSRVTCQTCLRVLGQDTQ